MEWDWGWVIVFPFCFFASLRGGVWQAITKILFFFWGEILDLSHVIVDLHTIIGLFYVLRYSSQFSRNVSSGDPPTFPHLEPHPLLLWSQTSRAPLISLSSHRIPAYYCCYLNGTRQPLKDVTTTVGGILIRSYEKSLLIGRQIR